MIAKLIARGEGRPEAIRKLTSIVEETQVWPVKTNAGFLGALLRMEEFEQGNLDTGLIVRKGDELTEASVPDAVLLAAVSWRLEEFMAAEAAGDAAVSPTGLFGFRPNGERAPARFDFAVNGAPHSAIVLPDSSDDDWQWDVAIDGRTTFDEIDTLPTTYGPLAEIQPECPIRLFSGGHAYQVSFGLGRSSVGVAATGGAILAPMPGKVTSVEVLNGEKVAKGQRLLTLEAMKMEHGLVAPFDGVVAELNAKAGSQVQVDAVLAVIEAEKSSS
jgi:3-methylcrotonyl-CoA carboxylase alpha subunit